MKRRYPKRSFQSLLVFIIMVLVASPFFYKFLFLSLIFDILITLIIINAVFVIHETRKLLFPALVLGVIAILTSWLSHIILPNRLDVFLVDHATSVIFFGFLIVVLFNIVFTSEDVTTDIIFGSIVVYLLMALEFGFIYIILDRLYEGGFHYSLQSAEPVNFMYYSFITLTTLGYGDIIPMIPPLQSIAGLEAVMGQLYLTILVARLVGLYVAKKTH